LESFPELNLTKYEGDDVSIQCKQHDEDQKSFCKAHEASMCVKDGVSLETIRGDRFSFSDEASTGVFTVNITDLREEDSGIYWCGAHVTTKVNLTVKKGKIVYHISIAFGSDLNIQISMHEQSFRQCVITWNVFILMYKI
jgi:hypothetical protein